MIFFFKTSLRYEQQAVNDDLVEFRRIYIRNCMQWEFFFSEREKQWVKESENVGKRAN